MLALREIVNDTGSDRGILLAESGFQSGAVEAARLTNVQVTSLVEVQTSATIEIHSMKLRELFDRLEWCREIYWGLPKDVRILSGLRPDIGEIGFSGDWAVKAGDELISKGFRGELPISPDIMNQVLSQEILEQPMPVQFDSMNDLLSFLEPLVDTLEKKLEVSMATE